MTELTIGKKHFFIPDPGSPCDAWKVYFEKLRSQLGKDNAKIIWLATWKANGSLSCTTNDDFNKFLKKNHIDVSVAATRAIADIAEIGENILGLGKTMTRIFKVGVPLVLGSVVLMTLWLLFKATKDSDAVDLALLASGGTGRAVLAAKGVGK
jgi:hypothetical protein